MYFAHSMRKLHVRGGRATGTYWAIFGVVLSTLILPLPEELALLGAGYLARQGSATLLGAYLCSLAAVLVGDTTTFAPPASMCASHPPSAVMWKSGSARR